MAKNKKNKFVRKTDEIKKSDTPERKSTRTDVRQSKQLCNCASLDKGRLVWVDSISKRN